jgi:hypothetical protein
LVVIAGKPVLDVRHPFAGGSRITDGVKMNESLNPHRRK